MDLATILNPPTSKQHDHQHVCIDSSFHRQSHSILQSPPFSPKHHALLTSTMINNMKPRSRFSALEDAIICQGVANGLTWGQISGQLPHRKRATCFNRYRTLQGIRKSRPPSAIMSPPSRYATHHHHHHPYPYYRRHSFENSHRHHHAQTWEPSSPPLAAPGLIMDTSSPMDLDSNRRLSTCSSLSSSSSLPSPSILQHDQWNHYPSSRRASNSSTTTFSSSTSSAGHYHYHRF